MRAVLLVVALLVLFVVVGWITFSKEPGRSSINLETDEIRQDTGEVMHQGSELLQEAEENVDPDKGEPTNTENP
jgi:hypothetical protein